MSKATPIRERIEAAWFAVGPARKDGGRYYPRSYFSMLHEVFPEDEYPRAFKYKSGGGPPGCAMAFGAAVRKMGGSADWETNGPRLVRLPADLIEKWTKEVAA